MNKILTLYHIEFKRIYKLFLGLLGLLFVGNIGIVVMDLFKVVKNTAMANNSKMNIGLLDSPLGRKVLLDYDLANIFHVTNLLLGLTVILVLLYAIVIWYRDFLGKSKTSYTLLMLPTNRFNIYIAKLITIVTMIYGVMLVQILSWFVDLAIISNLSKLKISQMASMFTGGVFTGMRFSLIQVYLLDFIMLNVIGVILAVLVIFTGVMIQKSYKKIGIALGVIYIGLSMVIYVVLMGTSRYSDKLLLVHSIYYVLLFTLSISISYVLINKKVYV